MPVSKMKQLAKERTGVNDQNSFYKLNPEVSDLPDKLAKGDQRRQAAGDGRSTCRSGSNRLPEHVMLKSLLSAWCSARTTWSSWTWRQVWSIWAAGTAPGVHGSLHRGHRLGRKKRADL